MRSGHPFDLWMYKKRKTLAPTSQDENTGIVDGFIVGIGQFSLPGGVPVFLTHIY